MKQYLHLFDERSIGVSKIVINEYDSANITIGINDLTSSDQIDMTSMNLTASDLTSFIDLTDIGVDQIILKYDYDLVQDAFKNNYNLIIIHDETNVNELNQLLIDIDISTIDYEQDYVLVDENFTSFELVNVLNLIKINKKGII